MFIKKEPTRFCDFHYEMKINFEKQGTPLEFLLRFLILFTPLYALIELTTIYYSNNTLTQLITQLQHFLLQYIGITTTTTNNLLFLNQTTFEIIPDCTGLMLIAMLASLLYATRSVKIEHKIKTLLFGGAALLIFNQIRLLTTLILFFLHGQNTFELVHFALWIIDSLLVLGIWLLAINKNLQTDKKVT